MRLERSHHTDRAMAADVRPRLRGWSHRVAAVLAVPAGVWLTLQAPPGEARWAAAVFAASIAVMLAASALVHWREWDPHTTEVLFRLDLTGIYLAIAGTATAVSVLALTGWHRPLVLYGVWTVALAGIVLEWLPFSTPRGLAHGLFLGLGWLTVPFVPAVLANRGWTVLLLMLGGGLLYTVGAVIVARQRPDPAPHVFGYHEIWHALVVAAVILHYAMVETMLGTPVAVA